MYSIPIALISIYVFLLILDLIDDIIYDNAGKMWLRRLVGTED